LHYFTIFLSIGSFDEVKNGSQYRRFRRVQLDVLIPYQAAEVFAEQVG
jgi:hypothetical protein